MQETSNAISCRRKEDFFSYDELRAVTLHNVYIAFSEHDSILPNYLEAITDTFEILKQYVWAVKNGQYQFEGKHQ